MFFQADLEPVPCWIIQNQPMFSFLKEPAEVTLMHWKRFWGRWPRRFMPKSALVSG